MNSAPASSAWRKAAMYAGPRPRFSGRCRTRTCESALAMELPHIGKTLEEKIRTLVETGEIPQAIKLRKKFPGELIRFVEIPGLGPKTARKIYDQLGIATLDELRAAAETGALKSVQGLGPKAEENILKSLDAGGKPERAERFLLSAVLTI